MSANLRHILLINPTITSRRGARFPLSLLALAAALAPRYRCRIIDGNVDRDYITTIGQALARQMFDAVGVTVMGGPQVASAIDSSLAVRAASPATPIIWGGYFPTLYPRRGDQCTVCRLCRARPGRSDLRAAAAAIWPAMALRLPPIDGFTWKRGDEIVVIHNRDRLLCAIRVPRELLPYELLADPRSYLAAHFLGHRTAAYQAALGCRFRCTFCGVAACFSGATRLPPAARLERDLTWLKDRARCGFDPVFRSQFLRSRSRHDSAAAGARQGATALVVLRPGRRPAQPVGEARGRWCATASCAWPTSAPNHRAMPCSRASAKARDRIRPSRSPICAAATASFPNCRSWWRRRRSRRRDRTHLRIHSPGQAGQPAGGDHRLHLHAAAGRESAGQRTPGRRRQAAAGPGWPADSLPAQPGGMEPAAVGRLCLPRGRALGERASAATHSKFRHGAGLPISDGARRAGQHGPNRP